MSQYPKLALCVGLVFSTSASAEAFRQHQAHVHGHVELNIAQDNHELLIEISAPGADVVGFEHQAENEQQKAALSKVLDVLNQPDKLITLSASAKCSVKHVDVRAKLASDDAHQHHDHATSEAEHEEHEHEGHDHEHEHSSHGSFSIEYHYQCQSISALNQIATSWFVHFPTTEHVDVNVLTDTLQTAVELSKDSSVIKL